MTITIIKDSDGYYWLTCKRPEFTRAWGNGIKAHESILFKNMQEIATWANNTLGVECLFELG